MGLTRAKKNEKKSEESLPNSILKRKKPRVLPLPGVKTSKLTGTTDRSRLVPQGYNAARPETFFRFDLRSTFTCHGKFNVGELDHTLTSLSFTEFEMRYLGLSFYPCQIFVSCPHTCSEFPPLLRNMAHSLRIQSGITEKSTTPNLSPTLGELTDTTVPRPIFDRHRYKNQLSWAIFFIIVTF